MEPQVASEDWRSFLGKNSAKRQPHINSSRPDIEETADLSTVRYLKRARASWTSLRPTIAVLVGVSLLFASLCGGGGRIRSGRTVRRLADGERGEAPSSGRNPLFDEDQWIALSAEELAVLCSQLGEWVPSFAPHGSSSPSVRLPEVASTSSGRTSQHILQSMQTPSHLSGAQPSETLPDIGRLTDPQGKPMLQDGFNWWGEVHSKNTRLAHDGSVGDATNSNPVERLQGTVQRTAETVSADNAVSFFPAVSTFFPCGQWLSTATSPQGAQQAQFLEKPSPLWLPATPPETTSASCTGNRLTTLVSSDGSKQPVVSGGVWVTPAQSGSFTSPGPSRLLGGPSRLPAALDLSSTPAHSSSHNGKHPFVRAPALMQGMDMDDLQATVSHPWSGNEPIARLLRTVRRVFLKEVLDVADAKELVRATLSLSQRCLSSMTSSVAHSRPSVVVESLGRRFLVFNTVHTVLKLMGGRHRRLRRMWQDLTTKIPTLYDRPCRSSYNEKHAFHHELALQLSAALELYKRGSSPSEDEVLSIKRKLFCLEFSPRCFLRESWEVWRQDDRNFPGGR